MATYTFRAVDLAGVPAQGELDAGSKQAVTDELRQRGLIVLDIIEQKTSVTSQDLFERFRRIKAHELTVMTRQLATMVASGMSILRAFHVLEDQTQLEKQDSLRRQVRAAMAYPIMIGAFALVVMLALVAFLIPVFEDVFKDFNGKLPAITRVSVGMSHLVTGKWWL